MPDPDFALPDQAAIPLHAVEAEGVGRFLEGLPPTQAQWLRRTGFDGRAGSAAVAPDADGRIALAAAGLGSARDRERGRFLLGAARMRLPEGVYALHSDLTGPGLDEACLGWLLAGYVFDRYAAAPAPAARLVAPAGVDAARVLAIAAGEVLTRDLINTPASDMGPDELAEAVMALAETHGATVATTQGDALLQANLPLVHAVGRASPRSPRLLDMRWGQKGPRITLVGKGVCFDTGGLNLKPGASMGLMKKDMGGAATALGLARAIMLLGLEVRLRVLIPAVENSVSGAAFRPGDILTARNGKTVEINNTDAEGRLVLADALSLATEDPSDLLVSMATLTGAARVAVGPDLAPFYTDDDRLAQEIADAGTAVKDPVWRMPFHAPYEEMIEPGIADLDNAPTGGMAGSITAALFLRRFAGEARYAHFDIYGWQPKAAPGRPKGGVGQGARALLQVIEAMT